MYIFERLSQVIMCILLLQFEVDAQSNSMSSVDWYHPISLEALKKESIRMNKPIFIDLYTTWCLPCKKMDKEVYTDSTVGDYLNKHYLSVKLQMDSSKKDSDEIKRMYSIAREVDREYKIDAFPTILTISQNGTILSKSIGYKNSSDLIKFIESSGTKRNTSLSSELQSYKSGEKTTHSLKELARYAKDVLNNNNLSKQIAETYVSSLTSSEINNIDDILFIQHFANNRKLADSLGRIYKYQILDVLSPDSFAINVPIQFYQTFAYLIVPGDNMFNLCYSHPKLIDSLAGIPDWALGIMTSAIINNEFALNFVDNGRPVHKSANWKIIEREIQRKYSSINLSRSFLEYKVSYYHDIDTNYKIWALYKNQLTTRYGSSINTMLAVIDELNNYGAWEAFLKCNDRKSLRLALKWVNLALRKTKYIDPKNINYTLLDTKGNLLYKLGRKHTAIKFEKAALSQVKELSQGDLSKATIIVLDRFETVIHQMRNNLPTCVEEGAIWANIN
jgi:thioredoxin-related protein